MSTLDPLESPTNDRLQATQNGLPLLKGFARQSIPWKVSVPRQPDNLMVARIACEVRILGRISLDDSCYFRIAFL